MKNTIKLIVLLMLVFTFTMVLFSCNETDIPTSLEDVDEPITDPVVITYRDASGKVLTTQRVQRGKLAKAPTEEPVNANEGYYFAGWTLRGELFDFSTTVINEDISLKASYSNVYSIKFYDTDGTTLLGTASCEYGKLLAENKIPESSTPIPAHYHNAGWTVKSNGQVVDLRTEKVKYGGDYICTYLIDSFDVVFYESATGKMLSKQAVDYNTLATVVTVEGKTIDKMLDQNGSTYSFETPITQSLNIAVTYANVKYKVTFVDAGGNTIGTTNCYQGNNATLPTKASQCFSCDVNELINIQSDKTVVLTAKSNADYTSFNPNLKTDPKSKDIVWNGNGTAYYFNKVGQYFEFEGWYYGNTFLDMNVGASFKADKISSHFGFYVDGVKVKDIYINELTAIENATPTSFGTWSMPEGQHTIRFELLETTFNEDLVDPTANMNDWGVSVSAITINQDLNKLFYTVNYIMPDGSILKTEQVAYAQTATPPTMYDCVQTESTTLPAGQYYKELMDESEFNGWMNGVLQWSDTYEIKENTDFKIRYTILKPRTIIFKDEGGNELGRQTVIHGSPATLPKDGSNYYAVVNPEDSAMVLSVTKDNVEVVLKKVAKTNYNSLKGDGWTTTSKETWEKTYGAVFAGDPEGGSKPSVFAYGTNFYEIGQSVTWTMDCVGTFKIRFRDDKDNQTFIWKLYVDGIEVWTYECNSGDPKVKVYDETITIPGLDMPAGTHTIKLELAYADASKSSTNLQSWSGCLVPQIWYSNKK